MGDLWKKLTARIHGKRGGPKGWQVGLIIPAALTCCACALPGNATGGPPPENATHRPPETPAPATSCHDCWLPTIQTTWQIQFTGTLDLTVDADVYDIDLFDTSASTVQKLHSQGRKAVCYIDAGTWEDWRPDAALFSDTLLGKSNGWPGERWLDIRQLEALSPRLEARLNLCKAKGFDGVEFDNVDGYTNDTGFPLTYDDQLRFNTYLANAAHERHLAVGLKNDPNQVSDLLPYFDWAIVEECFQFQECSSYVPFIRAGKPVLAIEYELHPNEFCPQARAMRFSALMKHRELDAFRISC